MRNSLLALIIVTVLAACSHNLREEFDVSINNYNKLLGRNEVGAAIIFAAEPIRQEFIARAKAAKNIRIFDYRIVNARYDEANRNASVDVEIDYYVLSSNRMKTQLDTQEWVYGEEHGVKGWRLMSPLPEFK